MMTYPRKVPNDIATRNVVLILTQNCNLNCRYCYETHKSTRKMPFEVGRDILKREFSRMKRDERYNRLEIAYLGGEPLLNFEVLKRLTEWTLSQHENEDYFFSIRTNGTLMSKEIREWLSRHNDKVHVGVSLDGLSEMNFENRNSCNIDLMYFLENWPKERVKITLFPDTVCYVSKTVRELKIANIPFSITIAEGIEWRQDAVETLRQQLKDVMPLYLDNIAEGVETGLFPLDPFEFYQHTATGDVEFCAQYENVVCYDVDGLDYFCHIFAPVTLGREKALRCRDAYKNLRWVKRDPICAACPIRTECKPCFGFHCKLKCDVNSWVGRDTYCAVKKMQAQLSAEYYLSVVSRSGYKIDELSRDDRFRVELSLKMLKDGFNAN